DLGGSGVEEIHYELRDQSTNAVVTSGTITGSSATVPVTGYEGIGTLSYYAIDNAGNQETAKTLTLRIDKTAPNVTQSRPAQPNATAWPTGRVTTPFTAPDSLSGMAGPTTKSFTFPQPGSYPTDPFTFTDQAGNTASVTTGVAIDLTAPTLTFGAPSPAAN